MEYYKRVFGRFNKQISLLIAGVSIGVVFYKPLKFIYYDLNRPEVVNDPRRLRQQIEAEQRKQLIKQKYKEYTECKDPDEKKRIYAELSSIHENRLMQYHRHATEGTKDF